MKYKWGLFTANLNPALDSEQRGRRPVLVVSEEVFNQVMPVVTILPITSRKEGRRIYPNEVLLARGTGDLAQDSLVLAHQIRPISKQRLETQSGVIDDPSVQEKIQQAIRIHLDL